MDIIPGDRASGCGGFMEPVEIGKEHGEFIILHKCAKCGHQKKNKTSEYDDFDEIVKISSGTGRS